MLFYVPFIRLMYYTEIQFIFVFSNGCCRFIMYVQTTEVTEIINSLIVKIQYWRPSIHKSSILYEQRTLCQSRGMSHIKNDSFRFAIYIQYALCLLSYFLYKIVVSQTILAVHQVVRLCQGLLLIFKLIVNLGII